jgi:hypothetical protein
MQIGQIATQTGLARDAFASKNDDATTPSESSRPFKTDPSKN